MRGGVYTYIHTDLYILHIYMYVCAYVPYIHTYFTSAYTWLLLCWWSSCIHTWCLSFEVSFYLSIIWHGTSRGRNCHTCACMLLLENGRINVSVNSLYPCVVEPPSWGQSQLVCMSWNLRFVFANVRLLCARLSNKLRYVLCYQLSRNAWFCLLVCTNYHSDQGFTLFLETVSKKLFSHASTRTTCILIYLFFLLLWLLVHCCIVM